LVAVGVAGAERLAQISQNRATPLEIAAQAMEIPGVTKYSNLIYTQYKLYQK
jgi:hypothetical protein